MNNKKDSASWRHAQPQILSHLQIPINSHKKGVKDSSKLDDEYSRSPSLLGRNSLDKERGPERARVGVSIPLAR